MYPLGREEFKRCSERIQKMLITDEKAEELIGSENNLINILNRRSDPDRQSENSTILNSVEIRPINNGGRRPGDKNLTQEQRNAVGVLAQFTPAKILSEQTGVSPSQISALKNGSHSTASYNQNNTETKNAINEQLVKIQDKALLKIMQSLDLLTEERMQKASIKDIAIVMNASQRVASLGKSDEADGNIKAAKIIVYSPKVQNIINYGPALEVESVERA